MFRKITKCINVLTDLEVKAQQSISNNYENIHTNANKGTHAQKSWNMSQIMKFTLASCLIYLKYWEQFCSPFTTLELSWSVETNS